MAAPKGKAIVSFKHERDTKGTHVYAEVGDDPAEHVVGKIYIKKPAATKHGISPGNIKVTIENA